jgi:hypothetical protein
LAAALRSIPRPEPVLFALPEDARKALDKRLAGLDAERKLAVHSDQSPLVENLPLLHLASGGTSPRAFYVLATTSAGTEELSGLLGVEHEAGGTTPSAARSAIVRELARRAALDFLRDRAADVLAPGKETALACRLVARVAVAVGRDDLVLLARELLTEIEPSLENQLQFAQELARAADPERAARELAAARADKSQPPPVDEVARTERMIVAAKFTRDHPAANDAATKLALARAWLRLGRFDQARALLEPELTNAKSELGLAAAYAESLLENPACPELPPDVGTAALCAESFRTSARAKAALALLDSAWQSGAGRDDEAIEVYTALALIVPWMHETAPVLGPRAANSGDAAQSVAILHDKIQQIVAIAPRLAGLALFVDTLRFGGAVNPNDADARSLSARALELAKSDSSRFAQAGVFAVAAALSRREDTSPLVDAVPLDKTESTLRVPRAALEVWTAASSGAKSRMDAARAELAQIMLERRGESFERARLVLSVSEADALLDGSERTYRLLSRVSGQLLQENAPPDLAFRAVLDASGALERGHRADRAKEVLAGAAAAELPPDFERARELVVLVRGYELVLSAASADAAGLAHLRSELMTLLPKSAAGSTAVWFELWSRELEAREKELGCEKKKQSPCREADALRRTPRKALDTRLGPLASAVLLRGALPSGSFDAGFHFSAESGLEPFIVFDPALLAIGLPKYSAD